MPRRPTKKRTGPIRKKARHLDRGLRLALAGLFLAAFLVVSLVFLGEVETRKETPPPVTVQQVDLDDLRSDVRVELEGAMLRSGISSEQLVFEIKGGIEWFIIDAAVLPQAQIEHLRRRLQYLDPDFNLQQSRSGEYVVFRGQQAWFGLLLRPEKELPPPGPAVATGRMAIVMDDLGRSLSTARRLLAIDLPVTLAIMPGTENAARVATMAHRKGREVIIHLPSEPIGYPDVNPGSNALLVRNDREQIQRRLLGYLEQVPYAVGGNNHMGSRFTADEAGMEALLSGMSREGMFFLDSRTSGATVAEKVAKLVGIPFLARDVFLDNEQDVGLIREQIEKAVRLARRRGEAIAICHPYPETLQALEGIGPFLDREQIEVVPLSALLHR